MTEKKLGSIKTIAIRHYLIAGLATPFALNIILLVALFLFVDKEGLSNLMSAILGLILREGTSFSYFFYSKLFTIPILITAFYFGTQWSTESIQKRYQVKEREKIVTLSTKIYFFVNIGLIILAYLPVLLTKQLVTISSPSLLSLLLAPIGILISTGLFYVISKKYLLVDAEKQEGKLSAFVPLILVVVVIGTVFLGYKALLRLDPFPQSGDVWVPINYVVEEIQIIPLGNVPSRDVGIVKDVLQENFPQIAVTTGEPKELSTWAYNSKKGIYNNILLLYAVKSISDDNSKRIIGVTSEQMDTSKTDVKTAFSITAPRSNTIVLSTFYLNQTYSGEAEQNTELLKERYRKALLRALGSSFGFESVEDKSCVMALSKTLQELDSKGDRWCGDEEVTIRKIQGLE